MKTETKTGAIKELIKAIKKTTTNDVLVQITGNYNGLLFVEKIKAIKTLDLQNGSTEKICTWKKGRDAFGTYIKIISIDYK